MKLNEIQHQLKERVAKGLNFGIEGLEEVIDSASGSYNDFVLIKSKYNDLMYVSSMNTLPYEQIELGLDRLRNNLLTLIDHLDSSSLKKQEVNAELKIQALPTRRTNFFKLLDIHFRNLNDLHYSEVFSYGQDQVERTRTGRQAVFELYQMHKRRLRNEEDMEVIRKKFHEYFTNEIGLMEVYLKNIKHILNYIQESEIDKPFFLNTTKSLFSRFELANIFYFVISGIDEEFNELVRKSGLIDESLKGILLRADHYAHFLNG